MLWKIVLTIFVDMTRINDYSNGSLCLLRQISTETFVLDMILKGCCNQQLFMFFFLNGARPSEVAVLRNYCIAEDNLSLNKQNFSSLLSAVRKLQ